MSIIYAIIGFIGMCIGLYYFIQLLILPFTWKKKFCPAKFNGWTKSFFQKHQFTDWYHQDHSQPECYDYEEWEERRCKCCGYLEQREIPYYKELEK